MNPEDDTLPASDLAAALLAGGAWPPGLSAAQAVALAWALKQACYAAWSTEPPRALRAAELLQVLTRAQPTLAEPAALADWCAGIAALLRGRMAEADAALQASAARWQALQRPLEAAHTQVPRVMALSMLGRHDEAAACGAAAQQAFVALGDVAAASKVSLNLGSLHLRRDDHAQAARHYRDAALLFARVGDTEHSVMADIGGADALAALGDLGEAARLATRARMRAQQHGLPMLAALADESLALLALVRGDYGQALAGLERVRRCYAELQLPQPLAIAEKQLADAYLDLRLLPEALALYDLALASMQALDMPDDSAWTLLQRARTLALMDRPAPAEAALQAAAQAFAQRDSASGLAAVALAQAEQALAQAARTPADGRAAAAELAVARAEAAARAAAQAGSADGQVRAATLQAEALLLGGQAGAARALFALTGVQARAQQQLALQLRCDSGEGLAALALGDEPAAARALDSAVAQARAQWRALPGDELRGAFLQAHLAPFQGQLALALRAHERAGPPQARMPEGEARRPPSERAGPPQARMPAGEAQRFPSERTPGNAAAARVLQCLDELGARALAARLQQGRPPAAGDDTTQALRARTQWLRRRVQRLADEGEPSAALTARLHSAEQALLEHTRRQRLAAPEADSSGSATAAAGPAHPDADPDQPLDVAALQRQLAADEAIVVQGWHGDELLAGVLRRDSLHLQRGLCTAAQAQAARQALRFQLDALRHGAAPLQAHLLVLQQRATLRLQQLHQLLWAPLAPALAGARQVLVVPAAGLADLPYAALHDGQAALVDHHALAQAPSLGVAAWGLARPPVAPRQVLALGDALRLPHAGLEAQAVAAGFAQGQALVGEAATLAALQRQAGQADLLHLACHARFRADNPMFAELLLHDAALTAEQAETLALRAGTVVLSACDSGLAGAAGADEQVGLVRAFLVAGAARVLASLWPVDDALTATLMAHFYSALRQGLGPAQALRQAQLQQRQAHPHPALWAGFAAHGGW